MVFKLQDIFDIDISSFIFKNEEFIIKHKINNNFIKDASVHTCMRIVYYLVQIVGNKFYGDQEKIILVKNLCNKCYIDYESDDTTYIEIFIIISNVNYIEDKKYCGEMYLNTNKTSSLYVKIGKYILFIF